MPIPKHLLRKIKEFAKYPGLNCQSCDCYVFKIDPIGTIHRSGFVSKKVDWSGGFDWSDNIVDKSATHLIMVKTLELKEL